MGGALRVTIAAGVGCLMGFVLFNMENLWWPSANPLLSSAQLCFATLLFPGLIGSMAFAGNFHALSLGVAGLINAIPSPGDPLG